MVRHKLTDAKIKGLRKRGIYGDGAGLYLRVHRGGSKSWVFVYRRGSVRRELGLGGLEGTAPVSLALARRKADEVRAILAEGSDPFTTKRATRQRATFAQVAERLIEAKRAAWSAKTEREWRVHLLEHAAKLGNIAVADVTTEIIEATLLPIWKSKPATGQRVRGKIEDVLDYATTKKLREGDNPARWTGHLEHVLAGATRTTGAHHGAMAYRDVPAFMGRLGDTPEERCLRLTILTAVRSGEAREAMWHEIELGANLWTVPKERTKTKTKPNIVPLTEAAIAALGEPGKGYVFEGAKAGRPIGNAAMRTLEVLKSAGVTVHGFRSSFRDWAGEETDHPREIAEWALSHTVGDSVERAYRRGDALDKRRALLNDWAGYCSKGPSRKNT